MKKILIISSIVLFGISPCFAVTFDFNSLATGYYTEAQFNSNFVGVSFDNTGGNGFDIQSSTLQPDFSGNAILNEPYYTVNNLTRATFASLTNFISVTLGDFNQDPDTLYLFAYDSSNNVIGSQSYNLPADSYAGITLSLSVANIAYVEFYGVGVNYNSVYWDNFTFNETTNPVPEPATILLLGAGLIGLAGYGRKKYL